MYSKSFLVISPKPILLVRLGFLFDYGFFLWFGGFCLFVLGFCCCGGGGGLLFLSKSVWAWIELGQLLSRLGRWHQETPTLQWFMRGENTLFLVYMGKGFTVSIEETGKSRGESRWGAGGQAVSQNYEATKVRLAHQKMEVDHLTILSIQVLCTHRRHTMKPHPQHHLR